MQTTGGWLLPHQNLSYSDWHSDEPANRPRHLHSVNKYFRGSYLHHILQQPHCTDPNKYSNNNNKNTHFFSFWREILLSSEIPWNGFVLTKSGLDGKCTAFIYNENGSGITVHVKRKSVETTEHFKRSKVKANGLIMYQLNKQGHLELEWEADFWSPSNFSEM